jgi:ankyrin repeat protein
VVSLLIAARADVDKARIDNGETPLFIASDRGHADVVSQLLAAGADVDKAKTDSGMTPLHAACQEGHTTVVSLLIAAQADIHKATTSDGNTPLHSACYNDHVEAALLLLLAGADLDRLNHEGDTPLDDAGTEETRAAVHAYLLPRAEAVSALRFIAEATGLNPDLADIVVYHGLVRRPALHWGLANE